MPEGEVPLTAVNETIKKRCYVSTVVEDSLLDCKKPWYLFHSSSCYKKLWNFTCMVPCLYYIYIVRQKEEARGMENRRG